MNTLPKTTKDISEALKNNCLYVFHVWGDGLRARVCGVRIKAGALQVKHLQQGTWANVLIEDRLIQG